MNYTINEEMKKTLYNEIYIDYANVKSSNTEYWDIPHFYSIILMDWFDNQKRVFHIESEEELDFFVKNFAYRDIIYIMQCPWRNRNDLSSRFNTDCINGIVYDEYLEECKGSDLVYLDNIYNYFGVDNYGEDDNPWEGKIGIFNS